MADEKPIIVIKKKGHHGGHHGGAWKVAYADFVTAMMAFFMVMWLINSASTPTKQAIASYFRSPGYFSEGSSSPILSGQPGILPDGFVPTQWDQRRKHIVGRERSMNLHSQAGTDDEPAEGSITPPENNQRGLVEGKDNTYGFAATPPADTTDLERAKKLMVRKLKSQIEGLIETSPELTSLLGMVDVKLEADGLNIEIMDTDKTSMFASGSAKISPEADAAFRKIAEVIGKVPNTIEIVGHTDAKPFSNRFNNYTNWELSADRANAARRLLESSGIAADRFTSVLGKADKEPRNADNPNSAENRRITLKLKFPRTQTIDFGADGQDLGKFLEEGLAQEQESAKTTDGSQPVHAMTAEGVVVESGKSTSIPPLKSAGPGISLESKEPPLSNPEYREPDLIFQDRPVIGPATPLSDN